MRLIRALSLLLAGSAAAVLAEPQGIQSLASNAPSGTRTDWEETPADTSSNLIDTATETHDEVNNNNSSFAGFFTVAAITFSTLYMLHKRREEKTAAEDPKLISASSLVTDQQSLNDNVYADALPEPNAASEEPVYNDELFKETTYRDYRACSEDLVLISMRDGAVVVDDDAPSRPVSAPPTPNGSSLTPA